MTEDKFPLYDDVIEVLNPSNGEVVGKVVNANKIQVHEQLSKAFKFKCKLSANKRKDVLLKTALYLENNKASPEEFENNKENLNGGV